MASSSSNTSSTSSSFSTASTPSAAQGFSESAWPPLLIRASAPAASADLGAAPGATASATAPGVVPSAIATATGVALGAFASASDPELNVATSSTTALGVSRSIPPPPPPRTQTSSGGKPKNVPAPTDLFDRGHRRRDRAPEHVSRNRNSMAGSQSVSRTPSQEWAGWETAADPTSTSAPSKWSDEASSSSHPSAWSKRPPSLPPIPTDTRPASATSSSTTPSPDINLVTAVATGAQTAPKLDAPTSSGPGAETIVGASQEPEASAASTPSSVPAVATSGDTAPERHAITSSTPGASKIVDAALEPNGAASAPPSAPGVKTVTVPSATTSAPGAAPTAAAATSAPGAAAPTIPSLRNNWVAQRWGIVPRPVERRRPGGGQKAFGGKPPVKAPSRPDLLCPWREQVQVPRRLVGAPPCWECRARPARVAARPCGHLGLCIWCYYYDNSDRCPCCASPIRSWLVLR